MTTLHSDDQIKAFRAKTLLSALGLEIRGLKRRGQSAYSIIKAEYGLRGNKQAVYDQLKEIIG